MNGRSMLSLVVGAAVWSMCVPASAQDFGADAPPTAPAFSLTDQSAPGRTVEPGAGARGEQSGDDEPEMLFSSHDGYVLFASPPPDGTTALSNVQGLVDGEWLNRAVIDDFAIEAPAVISAIEMSGIWDLGTGAETPLEGARLRLWLAGPDGLPGPPLIDQMLPVEAYETGDVYFGRPEVVYLAHLPEIELDEASYVVSFQPIGAMDNFFQLTSATGPENIYGIEVHVAYPDAGIPPWTPGHEVFGEYYDVHFTVWGEWVTDGTETCEEWCGTQSPFGCWCDEWCFENDDCCDDVCEECEGELDFCDPGIDPYICEGYCGGPSPGGCWCDDWCDLFDDCCDDVCEACEDELDFCDPGIDPYICEGYCGEMAPGGCWCDEWCEAHGDCCDDVCDECEDDVSFCDPNIDPYDCHGELNGDGVVNVLDLLILLENWGPCVDPDDCPADLNADGTVNVLDLLLLLENWGECPEPPARPKRECWYECENGESECISPWDTLGMLCEAQANNFCANQDSSVKEVKVGVGVCP